MSFVFRHPPSLALRLTVLIGVGISIVLLGFGLLVERSIDKHFMQQDIAELNAARQSVENAIEEVPTEHTEIWIKQKFGGALSGHRSVEFLLADDKGKVLYATPGVDLRALINVAPRVTRIDQDHVVLWQHKQSTYRSVVVPMNIRPGPLENDNGKYVLALATDIGFHLQYLSSFHRYLRWLTLGACLIAIATIWLAIYRGHSPIRRISQDIRRINSRQLHIRLNLKQIPTELIPLASAFNEMIGRLEDGFKRLSNYSGDIAHELRTPITNLTTQTQVALSKTRTNDAYREVLYSNLEEYERMSKMISNMLFLAQADSHLIQPDKKPVRLVQELQNLYEFFEAWAEENGVIIVIEGEPDITLNGDTLMLRRAFSNLLSNAIRHTEHGQTIRITVYSSANTVSISISNPGPSIPQELLHRLFERFYRPDASRQRNGEGAGLGLAIVKTIVSLHSGTIQATSEEGLINFQIMLPKQ